jgi:hypothetical protein
MSDFLPAFTNSLVKASGINSISSAFDFLNNSGKEKGGRPIPPTPILSSQYELEFFIGNSDQPISIFEIDNITKTLVSTEKKSFRPYGYTHNMKLMRYEGWDIKISGKKTNPALNYLIQNVYNLTTAPQDYSPNITVAKSQLVTPLFRMRETINQYPDESYNPRIREIYEYKNIIITGYDEEVPDDNMPLTYTLSLFARSRELAIPQGTQLGDYSKKNRPQSIDDQISKLVFDLTVKNKDFLASTLIVDRRDIMI